MWNQTAKTRWNRCVIAEASVGDWFNAEGYCAVIDGDFAAIAGFAADSICDAWAGIERDDKGEIAWTWTGTPEELIKTATAETDLMFPDRKIVPEDKDYELMQKLYKEIRKWARNQNHCKKKKTRENGQWSDVF